MQQKQSVQVVCLTHFKLRKHQLQISENVYKSISTFRHFFVYFLRKSEKVTDVDTTRKPVCWCRGIGLNMYLCTCVCMCDLLRPVSLSTCELFILLNFYSNQSLQHWCSAPSMLHRHGAKPIAGKTNPSMICRKLVLPSKDSNA